MTETKKVCSCFGHSDVEETDRLRERVSEEIDNAIANGVRVFLFGGISDFDNLIHEIVSEKKAQNPLLEIERVYCLPLVKGSSKPPEKKGYERLDVPAKSSGHRYTSISYRNYAMVDQSDWVLFYAEERKNSVAYKTYKYALRLKSNKKIVNFATQCK